jgi:hypothetical protein
MGFGSGNGFLVDFGGSGREMDLYITTVRQGRITSERPRRCR